MEIVEPISSKEMSKLFSFNERIIVPPYQRRFSWEEEHFEDLWNDLDALDDGEKHFFGTIVFMSNSYIAQETNEIDVVDGQQRITTVSILLCAIRDFLKEEHRDETEGRVQNINRSLWLTNLDGDRLGKRLVLGNLDRKSYDSLIESNFDEIENEKIKEAYSYFYGRLEKLDSLQRVKKLHEKILNQLIYVSITATGHKAAFHLFESMNNRGLSLSPIDLMKNYLLMRASERNDLDEERIEDLWGDIIKNLDSIHNINNPAITFFRQYFMSSKLLAINEKITKNKLYEPTFKEIIDKPENMEGLLKDIKRQSNLYKRMSASNISLFNGSKNSEINKLLKDARVISITPFTLLLRAFRELDDVENLKEVIKTANTLLIRRQICGQTTGSHDIFFNHLAQNAFDKENPIQYIKKYLTSDGRFPPDGQFKRYFARETFSKTNRTKYILSKIEEEHFGHGGKEVVESRYKVHIEHILPEIYGKSLKKLWLEPFTISKEEHTEYKKRIGNLTLLEKSLNIRASNRSLKKKQKYYDEDKTDFKMTHELTNHDRWGTEEIEKRCKKLAKAAVKIWNIQT